MHKQNMYNNGMNMKERAQEILTFLPAVYLAFRSPKTPVKAKILAGLTVAYALSPIDLIPDFIPGIGYLDDIIILPAMITWTIHAIPKELFDGFMQEARAHMDKQPKKKWVYAIPVLLIYALLLYWIISIFIH